MRFSKLKGVSFGLALTVLGQVSVAWANDEPWDAQFLGEFDQLKSRLQAVETKRDRILARQDEILKQLDILRIQIHHHPRSGAS